MRCDSGVVDIVGVCTWWDVNVGEMEWWFCFKFDCM